MKSYQHNYLIENQEELAKENMNFAFTFVHTSKPSLTCHKILRPGADVFTSPPKEGVQRIFIAIKIYLSRPRLIPRTLGPMASTLSITPPRTTKLHNQLL
jgi:hypothetical protein